MLKIKLKIKEKWLNLIRNCKRIKGLDKIVYVSCCPPMIIDNLCALCLP